MMKWWYIWTTCLLAAIDCAWMDDIEVENIEGKSHPLSYYNAKAILIVNVASQCGYTDSNYRLLQVQRLCKL